MPATCLLVCILVNCRFLHIIKIVEIFSVHTCVDYNDLLNKWKTLVCVNLDYTNALTVSKRNTLIITKFSYCSFQHLFSTGILF